MRYSKVGRTYPTAAASSVSRGDLTIINKLAQEFSDLSRKDIQTWRQAIDAANNAESPKWVLLQDLYEYLRTDGHFGSQIDIRKGLTEANRYYIRDSITGKEDPVKTKLLETEWIFNMIGDLLDHTFFGATVLQINGDPLRGMYDLLPRRNFIPQKDLLLIEATGDKGFSVRDLVFKGSIITVKNQYKYGIMNDIVPDLIWKKNARAAWAEFSEKFGIPLTTATTNTRDKNELDKIEAMLRRLGKATQAVFPTGTTIDVKNDVVKGDPYNVFLKQMEYNDKQISKRILGGTMYSDDGASRSQAEVHQDTANYILSERDRKKMEFTFNGQIIPYLMTIGFPFSPTDEFVYDRSQDLSLTDHWKIIKEALELGIDIDAEWISTTFNFPINVSKTILSKVTKPNTPEAVVKERSFFE